MRIRDQYGRGVNKNRDDGGPRSTDNFLLARRLVEAGVRCVTLAFSRWDWHNANFQQGREDMPLLDQGLSALVWNLHQRGMDKDVSVVVCGEFGRTPQVNKDAGRDHWPRVSTAMLAYGGIRTGQVIGSTDRLGCEVKDWPVHFQEILATFSYVLGIDMNTRGPSRTRLCDILRDKVVLGQEISITIVYARPQADKRFKVGNHFIVQADMLEYNSAVGYNIWGGMIQYDVFDERVQKCFIKIERDRPHSSSRGRALKPRTNARTCKPATSCFG